MTDRDVILDTNLLVLFVVGTASPKYIAAHKRLQAYTALDFKLLTGLLVAVSRVIVTPHVLAETSNLVRHANEPGRTYILETFRDLLWNLDENHVPSLRVAARPEFIALGLTDAVLLEAARSGATLITADFDLYRAALAAGLSVVNFTYHKANYL